MAEREEATPLVFGGEVTGRKGQILAAALDVFAEKGYEGGSMREIASHVGVSEAALYRHFTGKEAIFHALIEAFGVAVRHEALPKLRAVRAETLESDLRELLVDRRRTARSVEPALRVILPVVLRNREWIKEMKERVGRPALAALLEKVIVLDTELDVENAEATRADRVRMLVSLIAGYLATTFALEDERDDAMIEAVLRVMRWDVAQ